MIKIERKKLVLVASFICVGKEVAKIKEDCKTEIPSWEFPSYFRALQDGSSQGIIVNEKGVIIELRRGFYLYHNRVNGDWLTQKIEDEFGLVFTTDQLARLYQLIFDDWAEKIILGHLIS